MARTATPATIMGMPPKRQGMPAAVLKMIPSAIWKRPMTNVMFVPIGARSASPVTQTKNMRAKKRAVCPTEMRMAFPLDSRFFRVTERVCHSEFV